MRQIRHTRRVMLKAGGGAFAAAAFGPLARAAALPAGPAITRLSEYMAEAGTRALPEEVAEKTKQHILDTLAAMISGASLAPARIALQFAKAHA
ncbi:MAG: MmgE/PrpD family protein, partial [Acidobacteriia bacterium]|nr:MmgE/PrpD family protein [Terriglobia bacterium]